MSKKKGSPPTKLAVIAVKRNLAEVQTQATLLSCAIQDLDNAVVALEESEGTNA